MNARRDPDRLIHTFLLEGAEQLQDQAYDAVRAVIEHKRQRAVIGPWRLPTLNKIVPIGLGAAALVVALVVGSQYLGPPAPAGVGTAPSASPSPTASIATGLPEGPFTLGDGTGPLLTTVTIPSSGWLSDPGVSAVGKGTEVRDVPEAAILAWSWPAGEGFKVYGDPCHWSTTTPQTPVTTVDAIAAALAAQPSRDATDPVDVTVGGYAGKHVTLQVPGDVDFADCDDGNFASYGTTAEAEPARQHQGPGQIDALWILDLDGAITILDAMYRPDTPAELVEELRTIAESATFEPRSP
jgi:hypothetical protein